MHSIVDVSLRENKTEQRKERQGERGKVEMEGGQTKHQLPQSRIILGRKLISEACSKNQFDSFQEN